MLENVRIKNYQSLHDVSLPLGAFTVIVGPSSSGKSAFTRALKTLTSNQRGDSFITHGESQCTIEARTERGTVALYRGKKNEYVVIPDEDPSAQKSYTKLAGATPEEVSEFIGIPSKDPLNYSSQFDMPYLLTSSAAEVARTLGDLTNVSVIFEASREANRQRLQAASTLKTRAADYEALTVNLEKYKNLEQQEVRLDRAAELLKAAKEEQTRISRLAEILTALDRMPTPPRPREIPEVSFDTYRQTKRLAEILTSYMQQHERAAQAQQRADEETRAATRAEEEFTETLSRAGTCPTCGQGTEDVEHTQLH